MHHAPIFALVIAGCLAVAGCDGDAGADGPQGLAGESGPTGPAGEQGDNGPRGDRGTPGLPGDQGETGTDGLCDDVDALVIAGVTGLSGPVTVGFETPPFTIEVETTAGAAVPDGYDLVHIAIVGPELTPAGAANTFTLVAQASGTFQYTVAVSDGCSVATAHFEVVAVAPSIDDVTFTVAAASGSYETPPADLSAAFSSDDGDIGFDIVVPSCGAVGLAVVDVNLSHSWQADVDLRLTSPSGTTVQLFDGRTFTSTERADEAFTPGTFADTASHGDADDLLTPHGALAALIGEACAGTWTVTIADIGAGIDGVFHGWKLSIAER